MTGIKLCGLSRLCDIEAVNELQPDYIGFVFAPGSRRYVTPEQAKTLKQMLDPGIKAVGVFVRENPQTVARLLNEDQLDLAQLHGGEGEDYIKQLRTLTTKPIIKAFSMDTLDSIAAVEHSSADYVLLDSGSGGTGNKFNWELARNLKRPYFLAGGIGLNNAADAIRMLHPFAVDISSSVETDGYKDKRKMAAVVAAVRKEDRS